MAKATAIIFTFLENLAQMAHTDWDPDSNGNLYPFRQLRDNVVFNYPAYQTWIIYFYHCLTNHYTLLLRHVSTIRQGDFWKLLIVMRSLSETRWQLNQSIWNFQCFIELAIKTSMPNSILIDLETTKLCMTLKSLVCLLFGRAIFGNFSLS